MEESQSLTNQYNLAADIIKTAILQSQHEAAKSVNRVQLLLYYNIGKYLSAKTRKGMWGTNALQSISDKLRKDLPGLRGFSATSLKKMRLFYDNWIMIDANSSVATDELNLPDSSVTTDGLNTISLRFPNITDFPVEDFFRIPFTHHVEIYSRVKELNARYYYIHRTAEEKLSIDRLKRIISDDAYVHQVSIPNNFPQTLPNAIMARKAVMMFKDEYLLDFINVEEIGERESIDIDERVVEKQIVENIKKFIMTFGIVLCKSANKEFVEYIIQDYEKPMGVATYTTSADMPEKLRKALPDVNELKKLL